MRESSVSYLETVKTLDAETVTAFRLAIEIGKWPNGVRLTQEQREMCMQAVIAWEHEHLSENERTGYIDKGEKDGDVCDSHDHDAEKPIKFQ